MDATRLLRGGRAVKSKAAAGISEFSFDSESARYGRYFNHYCVVKPGLTGLWQVSGRNLTTYRRRVALDTYYAKHVSLKLDMLIVLKTFPAVLFQRGVS